jgi:hypothetical protein
VNIKLRAQPGQKYLEKTYDLISEYFDSVLYISMAGAKSVLKFSESDRKKDQWMNPDVFVVNSVVKEIGSKERLAHDVCRGNHRFTAIKT